MNEINSDLIAVKDIKNYLSLRGILSRRVRQHSMRPDDKNFMDDFFRKYPLETTQYISEATLTRLIKIANGE